MNIKTYTRPHCEWSTKLKEWLTTNGHKFEDFDLTEETTWRDEHIQISGQLGTPVINIEGNVLMGFNKSELIETIKKVTSL